jgi:magnesium-protoporphyrin O-methyltransferase
MLCSQCQGIEDTFNEERANDELKNYRKQGPSKQTRILLDAIKERGVSGLTLLDIGGGVGAIQHDLIKAGVGQVIDVDASSSYMKAAREEAERLGLQDRIEFQHGNFVDLAPQIEPVDIVTLDRVICCYHDMVSLVGLSSQRAGRLYGVIYPQDQWWTRGGVRIANFFLNLMKDPFRIFIHSAAQIEEIVTGNGLQRVFHKNVGMWQVILYAR